MSGVGWGGVSLRDNPVTASNFFQRRASQLATAMTLFLQVLTGIGVAVATLAITAICALGFLVWFAGSRPDRR